MKSFLSKYNTIYTLQDDLADYIHQLYQIRTCNLIALLQHNRSRWNIFHMLCRDVSADLSKSVVTLSSINVPKDGILIMFDDEKALNMNIVGAVYVIDARHDISVDIKTVKVFADVIQESQAILEYKQKISESLYVITNDDCLRNTLLGMSTEIIDHTPVSLMQTKNGEFVYKVAMCIFNDCVLDSEINALLSFDIVYP